MMGLFSAVVTENVIDTNMTLWRTGRKDLWNVSRVDDWAAVYVPFWYNKQSILKACRFSIRKICQFFILEETDYIGNWKTAQERYWLFGVKLTTSNDDLSQIDTSRVWSVFAFVFSLCWHLITCIWHEIPWNWKPFTLLCTIFEMLHPQ